MITGNRVVVLSTAVVYFLSFITTVCFVRDITPRGVPGDDASTIEMGRMQSPSTAAAESEEKGSQSFDAQRDDDVKVNPIIEKSQGSDTIRAAAHTVSKPQPYAVLSDHDDDLESANASNSSIMLSSPSSPVDLPESNTSFSAPPNTSPAIAVGTAFVKEIVFSKTFWRFCLLSLFLINLRAIFRHLDATLPTYLVRSFGANYPKGIIYAINPFIIILLTPVIAGELDSLLIHMVYCVFETRLLFIAPCSGNVEVAALRDDQVRRFRLCGISFLLGDIDLHLGSRYVRRDAQFWGGRMES